MALVTAAKDMSYAKSSRYVSGGEISRQTVMCRVRRSRAADPISVEMRRVPELHIDADEAHVTSRNGKKSEVPLISVYEGIECHGKRHYCKNVMHISEYGKTPDELWEQVSIEIERRYDPPDQKFISKAMVRIDTNGFRVDSCRSVRMINTTRIRRLR